MTDTATAISALTRATSAATADDLVLNVSGGATYTTERIAVSAFCSSIFASPTLVNPALGTPASGVLTNCTGLPVSSGISGLASGMATFLATPTSANLAATVTNETGSGALVFATSPTLVTPALGTPASGVLTSCTGLPISTGVSGLATGAATFLGTASSANLAALLTDETGSGAAVFATSPTLVTPLLGTPTSGTLTNCTGLPISSGVSGLGTGIATFLGTPSSANLAAALTDKTGTGANVFATSPTLVTPLLGTPTSGTLTNCTGLPVSTGISGFGTGVATALAVNTSSTGGFPVQTGPTSWTPSDQSGASLTFSSVSVNYTQIGNLIFVYGRLTYPTTADGTNAKIGGLPVTVANQSYATGVGAMGTGAAQTAASQPLQNTTNFRFVQLSGVGVLTNAQLSGALVEFNFFYPAA